MSIRDVESPHRILASDVVPVHVAGLLRHIQTVCDPGRGIAITLEVDESLYVSADPDLLVYALGVLLSVTCLAQPDLANVSLSSQADDDGIQIEAVGETCAGVAALNRPISLDLTFAQQAIASMNGSVELGRNGEDEKLFRLTLPPARPSRISSRPIGGR